MMYFTVKCAILLEGYFNIHEPTADEWAQGCRKYRITYANNFAFRWERKLCVLIPLFARGYNAIRRHSKVTIYCF